MTDQVEAHCLWQFEVKTNESQHKILKHLRMAYCGQKYCSLGRGVTN